MLLALAAKKLDYNEINETECFFFVSRVGKPSYGSRLLF